MIGDRVAARFAGARTDPELLRAALVVEDVAALAYAAAAAGPLSGLDRARALAFADHERDHAAAMATLMNALTVPVRGRAGEPEREALVPGLATASRRDALRALAELEQAAIDGHAQLARRLEAREALATVAMVAAGGAQHLAVLRGLLGQEPVTTGLESG